MNRTLARWIPLLAALAAACGPAPATPAGPAQVPATPAGPAQAPATPAGPAQAAATPAGPAQAPRVDEATARRAVDVALASLSKRSFDVDGCAAAEARVVPEREARAGVAAGDRCAVLVAQQADRTWLVVVRSSLPSKSVGAQALVTVNPEAKGVGAIEYAR